MDAKKQDRELTEQQAVRVEKDEKFNKIDDPKLKEVVGGFLRPNLRNL